MASSRGLLVAISVVLMASASLAIRLPAEAARRQLSATEPTAPAGWWQSVSIAVGTKKVSCGLRDFPPIPDGYGSSRMLCGGYTAAYDPYWVWKLTKVPSAEFPDVLAPEASNIVTGEQVHMRIFNPMLSYCQVASNQVKCGVSIDKANLFSVEKIGAPGDGQPVDFNVDSLFLKSNNKYCRLKGQKNSAFIYCDLSTSAGATVFQMPYSHYYAVSLKNTLSNNFCGANFIPLQGDSSAVNCTAKTQAVSNFYTKMVVTAKTPGSSVLSSGLTYAMTSYEELYHYQVAAWSSTGTGAVNSISNDTEGDALWFVLERANAAPGSPLNNGDVVAIKSAKLGKYCGIASATSQLKCDLATFPTSSPGYTFQITIGA